MAETVNLTVTQEDETVNLAITHDGDTVNLTIAQVGIKGDAGADGVVSDAEIETAYNNQVTQPTPTEIINGTSSDEIRTFSVDDVKEIVDEHSGGGTVTSTASTTVLAFTNIAGVFHANQTQSDGIYFTLASSGNIDGGVLYKQINADGTNSIAFSSDFDILHGISNGEILAAGVYEFFFLYKPSGKVTVNVLSPDTVFEDIFWENFVDTYEVPASDNLKRDLVTEGWTASAHSVQQITTGLDATFEFEIGNDGLVANDAKYAIGLNNVSTNNSFDDIDFAVAVSNRANGDVFATIFQSGSVVGTNQEPLENGDVIKIQVLDDEVTYYVNDVLWYTSLVTPTYPLFVDCSLHGDDSEVVNPVITIL